MSDVFSPDSSTPQGAPATPSAPPAAATPAAPAAPVASATPQAPAPQAPATGAPGDGWVPSYRVRETREAAIREAQTQFAQKEAEYKAQLERIQSQLHALVGVQQPNQDPEQDAIKSQFSRLYPGLAKLEAKYGDLETLLERAGDLESQNEHYWQSYGRQTMDRLFTHAQESMGGPLSEEAKRALHSSFVGFVQSSPELTARYSSDPSIVEDFWKAFSSSFIDPIRRTSAAGVATRAAGLPATPQDTPGGIPAAAPGPKPANLDDRTALAWATYQQTARK